MPLVIPPTHIDADAPPDSLPTIDDFLGDILTVYECVKLRGINFSPKEQIAFKLIKAMLEAHRQPHGPGNTVRQCRLKNILQVVVVGGLAIVERLKLLMDEKCKIAAEMWHVVCLARTSVVMSGAINRLDQLGVEDPLKWSLCAEAAVLGMPDAFTRLGKDTHSVLSPAACRCLRYISLKHDKPEVRRAAMQVLVIAGM